CQHGVSRGGFGRVVGEIPKRLYESFKPMLPRSVDETLRMWRHLGYLPNVYRPRTFNEKIAHRKLFTKSVVKNPSICKGETPRSIVYTPQEVAGHARSAKTEGQHVSDGDHRGACAQRPFPATAGCRGGLSVHSRARSPCVL